MKTGVYENLVHSLLRRSRTQRSIPMLAMAIKAHKPDWGSQGTLAAVGMTEFLNFIDWHFDLAKTQLAKWAAEAAGRMDDKLLGVRVTQIRTLINLVERPRPFALQPNPEHPQPELAEVLCRMANAGLTMNDLDGLQEMTQASGAISSLREGGIIVGDFLPDLLTVNWDWMRHASAEDELEAVIAEHRDFHPNVLRFQVTGHIQTLGRIFDKENLRGKWITKGLTA
jgi:hypothetical protein